MPYYVRVPTPDGVELEQERDLTTDQLSTLSQQHNALKKVLSDRDPWAATRFRGVTIRGHQLAWHPDDIEAIEEELDFDEFYVFIPPS